VKTHSHPPVSLRTRPEQKIATACLLCSAARCGSGAQRKSSGTAAQPLSADDFVFKRLITLHNIGMSASIL
jgi:hypothetical protein